jgi:hypothetical protein
MDFLIPILFFVTIIACSGMLLGFVEGRRKYKLELHKEDRRLVEARTQELEAQNKRVELEYHKALLEIERFDRRTLDAGAVAVPPAVTPTTGGTVAPAATPEPADSSTSQR